MVCGSSTRRPPGSESSCTCSRSTSRTTPRNSGPRPESSVTRWTRPPSTTSPASSSSTASPRSSATRTAGHRRRRRWPNGSASRQCSGIPESCSTRHRARQRLHEAGLAQSRAVAGPEALALGGKVLDIADRPVIVKDSRGSGSKDVLFATTPKGWCGGSRSWSPAGCPRAGAPSRPMRRGRCLSAETWTTDERTHLLGVSSRTVSPMPNWKRAGLDLPDPARQRLGTGRTRLGVGRAGGRRAGSRTVARRIHRHRARLRARRGEPPARRRPGRRRNRGGHRRRRLRPPHPQLPRELH